MDCSTIIVSFNTRELTREAVRTALEASRSLNAEVIVVDNNSSDGSIEFLREAFDERHYPNVHLVSNEHNIGFSKANNIGARVARGEVLFFLNPDTVVHDDAIRQLHDFLVAHAEAGAAGPHVLNVDGTDQRSTSPRLGILSMLSYHLPVGAWLRGFDQHSDRVPTRTEPAEIVNGCALAIRRSVFDEVGGWDESYALYSEELELCTALLDAGYVNYFVREAKITHYGGASTAHRHAEQQVVQQRSTLQYIRRHHGSMFVALHRSSGAMGFGARAVAFRVLARLTGEHSYERRGKAASRLFRWFLAEYD